MANPNDKRTRFALAMTMLAETLHEELSDVRLEGYWFALQDLSIDQIESAVRTSMSTSRFFPKPVELREAILGDPKDRTEVGWLSWRTTAKAFGAGSSVLFLDAAMGDTIMAVFGSWAQACTLELTPEMWAAKRKEFDRVYRVMSQRALSGARYLPGQHELQNSGRADWMKYVAIALVDGEKIHAISSSDVTKYLAAPQAVNQKITSVAEMARLGE